MFRLPGIPSRTRSQLREAASQNMTAAQSLQAYLSGASLERGTPGTITITVGTDTQRTWTIPKELLAQRSHVFKQLLLEDTKVFEKHFPSITPHAFADFLDYLRSSIYTPNTKVAGYNAMRTNIDACILGAQLGADEYRKAALRTLHRLFAPLAHSSLSNATRSMIRAADIAYVCERAGAANLVFAPCVMDLAAMMKGLRMLCYDALAAHWTQRNVVFFSSQRGVRPRWGLWRADGMNTTGTTRRAAMTAPPLTWGSLFERFPEFRERVTGTAEVTGRARAGLLKEVEEYFLVFGGLDSTDSSSSSSSYSCSSSSESESGGGGDAGQAGEVEEKSAGKGTRRKRLTIKLRGLGRSQESVGEGGEEQRTTTTTTPQPEEEDMRPEYIENVDSDVGEEMRCLFRVESNDR